jgi:hypothetical protein
LATAKRAAQLHQEAGDLTLGKTNPLDHAKWGQLHLSSDHANDITVNAVMPRLDETTQDFLHDAERRMRQSTSYAWDSFSNFALRDNVLEVAVGLM